MRWAGQDDEFIIPHYKSSATSKSGLIDEETINPERPDESYMARAESKM